MNISLSREIISAYSSFSTTAVLLLMLFLRYVIGCILYERNNDMSTPKCLILMASYNGEKYIRKQIDSILRQTYSNFDLLIRDDNSSDSTVSIIRDIMKTDSRVSLIENNTDLHSAYHNFHELIIKAKSMQPYDYYFFSDQDDIWVDTKLEKLVS